MENKPTSLKENFIYQMMYEIIVLILPLITSPYIARVIGADGLGIYSYSYSVAYYFVLFSALGIKNYGNRSIARVRDDQESLNYVFSNLAALHIIISLLVCSIYFAYVLLLRSEKIYATIQILYVLSGLFDISWFYFGIEKFKLTVLRNTLVKIFNVVCVFAFVKNASDLWKYCLIMALGAFFSQIVLWFTLKKYVKFIKPSINGMKVHMKPLLVLFIPAVAISLYKYMDKIMLGSISSKTELGWYENAEKIISIPLTVISSFGTVMLPKMSSLAVQSNKNVSNKYIAMSMKYVMCIAFAMTFGIMSVGKIFAPLFWGEEFVNSGPLIMGLAVTMPFIAYANVLRTQFLIPHERDKEYLISIICGAVFNLVVNAILIPRMGAKGATMATIGAEASVCLIQAYEVRKELPLYDFSKSFYPFLIMGVVMFGIIYPIGNYMGVSIVTLFVQIVLGGILYVAACAVYFFKTRDAMVRVLGKRGFGRARNKSNF